MADAKQYRVLRGLDYPPLNRAEPGDIVDDLPKDSIEHELRAGNIEIYKPKAKE